MPEQPSVLLDLTNRPENVALVREALTGVAEALRLDGGERGDVLTAVTEACNNVVLHAYGGELGPLQVRVALGAHALGVTVRDHGVGLSREQLQTDSEEGIGLPVIRALCHDVRLRETRGGGTEILMELVPADAQPLRRLRAEPNDLSVLQPAAETTEAARTAEARGARETTPAATEAEAATCVTLAVAPIGLARAVLPRMLCALAARARFSTDRISDAQLLADALVAHARESLGVEHLRVAAAVRPRSVQLRVGPLGEGRSERLIGDSRLDGLGPTIERLADSHRVSGGRGEETLTLALNDRRRG